MKIPKQYALWLCHFFIPHRNPVRHCAAIMLITLGCVCNVFSAEFNDFLMPMLSGDLDKVKALLKDNPDLIKAKGDNGDTLLHYAAVYSMNSDIAKFLIANNADVNATDNSGLTPLHFAAGANGTPSKNVVEFLLANKADVNAKANDGTTAMHYAASWGDKDVVELLLTHGADVNAAADPQIVKLWFGPGSWATKSLADVGKTPLDWAIAAGHKDVANLLRRRQVTSIISNNYIPLLAIIGVTVILGSLYFRPKKGVRV